MPIPRGTGFGSGFLRLATVCLPMVVVFVAGCAPVGPSPPSPAPGAAAKPAPRGHPIVKAPAPEPGSLTAEELAELWDRATQARAQGRWDEALRNWELVWSEDPGYRGVADLLEEEYRVHGLDAFARGRTAEAVAFWEKALRIDPTDRKTRAYLEHAQSQQSRLGEIPGGSE